MNTATHPRVAAKALRMAAEHIRTHGWVTGAFGPPGTSVHHLEQPCCAAGGINLVCSGSVAGDGTSRRAATALVAKLALLEFTGVAWEWVNDLDEMVGNWNDTHDDAAAVTETLDECADHILWLHTGSPS